MVDRHLILARRFLLLRQALGVLCLPPFDIFFFLSLLLYSLDGLLLEELDCFRHMAEFVLPANSWHGNRHISVRDLLHNAGHFRYWPGDAARQPHADENRKEKCREAAANRCEMGKPDQ